MVRSQFGSMVGKEGRLSHLVIDLEMRDGTSADTFWMLN